MATFLAYGLGMGMTLAILTIGVALARSGIVRTFRRVLPYVNRISGGFLIVAGAVRRLLRLGRDPGAQLGAVLVGGAVLP